MNSYANQLKNIRSLLDNFMQAIREDPETILAGPKRFHALEISATMIKNELYLLELAMERIIPNIFQNEKTDG